MEKLDTLTSADIVAQNIEKLKELFPTAFSEGKLIVEELQALVGEYIEKDKEYYQMTWAGKTRAQQEANKVSTGTLRPSKAESKDWDTTGNIFIEGDNLEVLKLLQKTYSNKIKMIYIDPPYNTGKDFVYKDNYADNLGNYLALTGQTDEEGKKLSSNTDSDGRYHSHWLNMMYPRLKLARNLLTEDGVIFISIDDNEQANLKKVCDEIFGEENFVASMVRKRRDSQANLSKNISPIHEYVLAFSKLNDDVFNRIAPNINQSDYKNPDNDPRGVYTTMPCTNKGGSVYEVELPNGRKLTDEWRFKKETFERLMLENRIVIPKFGEGKPRYKLFLDEKIKAGVLPNTWLDNLPSNQDGTREIKRYFSNLVFDTPKPIGLIKFLIDLATDRNSVILDFFAGSGTTANSVIIKNMEDSGSRKVITVQLPEPTDEKSEAYKAGYKTIAEITKERIRRAGELVKKEYAGKEGIEKLDVGFRVFKLDSSNIHAWDTSLEKLQDQLDMFDAHDGDHIKADRTEEDVLFEILLKYGLELTLPIQEREIAGCRVHNIGFGTLYICLSKGITAEVAQGIGEWQQEFVDAKPSVIFKDAGFKDDQDKTNSVQTLRQFGIENVKSI